MFNNRLSTLPKVVARQAIKTLAKCRDANIYPYLLYLRMLLIMAKWYALKWL